MSVYVVHVCVKFILYLVVYMIGGACGACVCILYIYVYMMHNFTYIYLVVHLMFSGACVVHMYVCV